MLFRSFSGAGLKTLQETTQAFVYSFHAIGGNPERKALLKNIVGMIPGTNPAFESQSIVIGAHYDHLGLGWTLGKQGQGGQIHNGADDNASGVAILLELARVLSASYKPQRTIIFAAFSGEEVGRKGSIEYVKSQAVFPASKIIGMINLDTVGRLGQNKLTVLGSQSATEWPHIFRGVSYVTGIPTAMAKENLDASDHVSFHEVGVPAVQFFSGPNLDYHRPSDTFEKIDGEGLVKIAAVLKETVEYLANRREPMTVTLPGLDPQVSKLSRSRRKVSLGTIPDFTYQGAGYRLDGTVDNSPAHRAGLRKGDIIMKIEDQDISGLKDLSEVLKTFQPGQRISITYVRSSELLNSDLILEAN